MKNNGIDGTQESPGDPCAPAVKKAARRRLPTAAFPKLKRYCDGLTTVGFTVCWVVVVLLLLFVEVVVVPPLPEA